MGSRLRLVRNVNQSRRFRFVVLIVGCFVVTMTFLVVSKPHSLALSNFGLGSSLPSPQPVQDMVNGDDNAIQGADPSHDQRQREEAHGSQVSENNNEKEDGEKNVVVDTREQITVHELTETGSEIEEGGRRPDQPDQDETTTHDRLALPTVSNYNITDRSQEETSAVPERLGEQIQTPERKPLCDDSDRRSDICDMYGDIRFPAKTYSVVFMESSKAGQSEVWQVHPYPRKGDEACLNGVKPITVKASSEAPQCSANHDVPAVVFSLGGYSGNLYHDFSDVLLPLFLTARQFDGEVQFVVTDFKSWWITKFLSAIQKLSKYPVIDMDSEEQVHCFKHVIVGLRAHNEFHIDPTRAPNGYTMKDFTKFMRSAYSVGREAVPNIEDHSGRKPRLLIVSRRQSRAFTNLGEIVETAEEMGYEVVVDEADVSAGLARFAGVVNSCDVMMGVHGTGLTNMVFLPQNATLIQIVPWGGLEWIATLHFGAPAKELGLDYVEYTIGIEESTLSEQYPRNHPVFTDPLSFHNQGFHVMRSTFMDNQNVKLDVKKFREVLWKTLENLIQ